MPASASLILDHIALTANTLDEGLAYVRDCLGVDLPAGGAHALMGTHNHLMRLGDGLFLEVIAVDPAAADPRRARWFNLDHPVDRPSVSHWLVRTDNIERELAVGPKAAGVPVKLSRGDLNWWISVPDDGSMPFDGAYPSLLQWRDGPHPANGMADLGCSLIGLNIEHPHANEIVDFLGSRFQDSRVNVQTGTHTRIRASISTPNGTRVL